MKTEQNIRMWPTPKTRHSTRKARIQPAEKRCPHCGETKPATEFHTNNQISDGLHTRCKPCTREYRKFLRHQRKQSTGRQHPLHGEKHHSAVLTDEQVHQIKDMLELRDYHLEAARALSATAIAHQYGVCKSAIHAIAIGKNWKHVL